MIGLILVFMVPVSVQSNALKAPPWDVSEWINGEGVNIDTLRGTVLVVEFFQLWCPGCNQFSIPLMLEWNHAFTKQIKEGKLRLLSIHTVFEGHDYQTPEKLRRFVKEKGIHHLVGIDRHVDGSVIPETMKRYRTGGTPEIVIVDKKGFIRFQKFGAFDQEAAARLIERLMME